MEGSDAFGTPAEIEGEDPFAGTDFGDFGAPEPDTTATVEEPPRPEPAPIVDPDTDVPLDTAGLPVVDREGQPVADKGPPLLTPEQQAAEAAAYRQQHGEPEPEKAEPVRPPLAEPEEQQAKLREIAERQREMQQATVDEGEAEAAAPPTPAAGAHTDAPPAETPQEPAQRPYGQNPGDDDGHGGRVPNKDGTPFTDEQIAAAESAGPTEDVVESEVAGGDAAPPAEKKDKTGRTTHRRYLILQVDGNGKYSEITWYEDSKGNIVGKGTKNAKRQKYALARGQDDALKIGYAAMGAPARAHIVAVAVSSFQPKIVEPEPPQPERARLRIR